MYFYDSTELLRITKMKNSDSTNKSFFYTHILHYGLGKNKVISRIIHEDSVQLIKEDITITQSYIKFKNIDYLFKDDEYSKLVNLSDEDYLIIKLFYLLKDLKEEYPFMMENLSLNVEKQLPNYSNIQNTLDEISKFYNVKLNTSISGGGLNIDSLSHIILLYKHFAKKYNQYKSIRV